MCEVFTSILARNQGGMRDFLQASLGAVVLVQVEFNAEGVR